MLRRLLHALAASLLLTLASLPAGASYAGDADPYKKPADDEDEADA